MDKHILVALFMTVNRLIRCGLVYIHSVIQLIIRLTLARLCLLYLKGEELVNGCDTLEYRPDNVRRITKCTFDPARILILCSHLDEFSVGWKQGGVDRLRCLRCSNADGGNEFLEEDAHLALEAAISMVKS